MGLGWLADVAGAALDWFATDEANAANARALESQMAFNREVMQNRHQWEVEDLRKAGLNPLMSTTSPTGTLSAPNSSPSQKANLAQSAAAFANIDIARKNAEAQLNSSKADLANARTNEVNANTAKAVMENEVIRTQNDFRIASEQINIAERNLNLTEKLNNANIRLTNLQSDYQKIVNVWQPKLMKAELDQREQQIVIDLLVANATVENLRAQAAAATSQAESARITAIANSVVAEAERQYKHSMTNLTDNQASLVTEQIITEQKTRQGTTWQTALAEDEAEYQYQLYRNFPWLRGARDFYHKIPFTPSPSGSAGGPSIGYRNGRFGLHQ